MPFGKTDLCFQLPVVPDAENWLLTGVQCGSRSRLWESKGSCLACVLVLDCNDSWGRRCFYL